MSKSCADIGRELGLEVTPGFYPKECCNSCHEDHDEYGYDLILMDDGSEVCCAIYRLYEELDSQ